MTIREHLISRHFDIDRHINWIDEEERVATFPLLNASYRMVGYQQYRPDSDKKKKNHPREGRYFSYCVKDSRGVWGMESWHWSNTLFVTEGVFDACRITEKGHSAIAVISNDPKHLSNWLYIIKKNRPVVTVCDAGPAGKKLAKYGHVSVTLEEGDLGDASDEFVMELLNEYSL